MWHVECDLENTVAIMCHKWILGLYEGTIPVKFSCILKQSPKPLWYPHVQNTKCICWLNYNIGEYYTVCEAREWDWSGDSGDSGDS